MLLRLTTRDYDFCTKYREPIHYDEIDLSKTCIHTSMNEPHFDTTAYIEKIILNCDCDYGMEIKETPFTTPYFHSHQVKITNNAVAEQGFVDAKVLETIDNSYFFEFLNKMDKTIQDERFFPSPFVGKNYEHYFNAPCDHETYFSVFFTKEIIIDTWKNKILLKTEKIKKSSITKNIIFNNDTDTCSFTLVPDIICVDSNVQYKFLVCYQVNVNKSDCLDETGKNLTDELKKYSELDNDIDFEALFQQTIDEPNDKSVRIH